VALALLLASLISSVGITALVLLLPGILLEVALLALAVMVEQRHEVRVGLVQVAEVHR
tara:strand:- start:323 stop:496 length:174 start_codon:yes stop_codon:yes gene_type:complete